MKRKKVDVNYKRSLNCVELNCFSVIDASKITSVVHVPSTTTISLSTIATFTPQQHQLIQQSATLPHQVVMVPGQGPQRVQQAIPINVGTLVATPNNLVSSGIPFVVPGK